jgi:predicted permease
VTGSLTTVVPLVGFFLLGAGLRRTGLASDSDGQFLLRLLFFVALPALIVSTVAGAELRADKALLPLSCVVVSLAGMAMAWAVGRRRGLPPERLGPTVLGAMILNDAFIIPFVAAGYGDDALADLILFDLGNSLMVALVAFPLAFRFGGLDSDLPAAVRRTVTAPITWALVVGLTLSRTGTAVPELADRFLSPLAALVGPLILVALGIQFRPGRDDAGLAATTVAVRMVGGLAVGAALVLLFGFQGHTAWVVLLCSASPIGFTALTFSSLASLDTGVAARAVSASLVVGLVAVPLLVSATS